MIMFNGGCLNLCSGDFVRVVFVVEVRKHRLEQLKDFTEENG